MPKDPRWGFTPLGPALPPSLRTRHFIRKGARDATTGRLVRGFGAMTPEMRRVYGQRGGLASQATGTAHRFDHVEAKAWGRKGGLSRAARVAAATTKKE